ncbi:hypothetical protein ACWD4X_09490 [Streptomyces termitum]
MDMLHNARQARNWIAHEGASIGAIWYVDQDRILQHAVKLRAAVTDLALSDNDISQWFHDPAEPQSSPSGRCSISCSRVSFERADARCNK